MNIKQDCCRKVPNVTEPLFHMRPLGQQDVLKLFQTQLVLGFLTKLFSFSPKVLFLKLWIITEDAKKKMNISRKSWSYYFWILEWLSTAKIGSIGISSKTNFISELIRESRNSGNIMKISQGLFQKKNIPQVWWKITQQEMSRFSDIIQFHCISLISCIYFVQHYFSSHLQKQSSYSPSHFHVLRFFTTSKPFCNV